MILGRRILLIVGVSLACISCDQVTKLIASRVLGGAGDVSYLGGVVRLELVHNDGGFLSLGAALPAAWRSGVFSVGVGLLLAVLLGYALLERRGKPWTIAALALAFAGGASNLGDRIFHGGRVVDFLNVGIGGLRTGIFNVADMAILAGMAILFANALREPERDRGPASDSPGDAPREAAP